MKKLSLLIALAMLATCCAAMAETAATPTLTAGDYTYILQSDGTAQIVNWDGEDEALIVPAKLDGVAVTSVSESAFAECVRLSSIVLPEGVREIGDGAFSDCLSLASVKLPEGLETIGTEAFSRCEGLTAIALPDSVTRIGQNPFRGCANLMDVFVSPDHPYLATVRGVLFSKPDRRLVCYPLGIQAERYAVPEGVRRIGAMAFDRNLYLESVALPETVAAIEDEAFFGCQALLDMNLPASVQEIGAEALDMCGRMTLTVAAGSYAEQYVLSGPIADRYVLANAPAAGA